MFRKRRILSALADEDLRNFQFSESAGPSSEQLDKDFYSLETHEESVEISESETYFDSERYFFNDSDF